jgi:hypothetical protein
LLHFNIKTQGNAFHFLSDFKTWFPQQVQQVTINIFKMPPNCKQILIMKCFQLLWLSDAGQSL